MNYVVLTGLLCFLAGAIIFWHLRGRTDVSRIRLLMQMARIEGSFFVAVAAWYLFKKVTLITRHDRN